jgi:hypothetical protein
VNDNGNTGTLLIIYGTSSYPAILYISTLTSSERLVINGNNKNENFGKYLISKSGSVSGCFDILVCSNIRCYVISCIQYYENSINVDELMLNGKSSYTIEGSVISSIKHKIILSTVNDVNGDGLSDFIVSCHSFFSGSGVVYVIFGTELKNNANVNLDIMDIYMGITITHSGYDVGIGSSISDAGDINGDGVNDIVIGSYAAGAFVVYGGSNISNIDLMNLPVSHGYSITTSVAQTSVDFRVVGNIDVNHDGISDIAIGCPYDDMAERVYVIYGTYNKYRWNVVLEYMTSAQGLVI